MCNEPLERHGQRLRVGSRRMDRTPLDPNELCRRGAADNPPQAAPTNQSAQRAIQVSKLSAQASFVGGVDVASDIANPTYAQAYTNLQGQVDPNEIADAMLNG